MYVPRLYSTRKSRGFDTLNVASLGKSSWIQGMKYLFRAWIGPAKMSYGHLLAEQMPCYLHLFKDKDNSLFIALKDISLFNLKHFT